LNEENKEKVKLYVCKIKGCGRPTHKESKYCIFHASAEEKTEGEFKEALKEYINKIKNEGINFDFKRFIFVGNISFENYFNERILKRMDFDEAIFEGDAAFYGIEFGWHAGFSGATFKKIANFSRAIFVDIADFYDATFNDDVIFGGTLFRNQSDFSGATFNGISNFSETVFFGEADFTETTFNEDIFFNLNEFIGNLSFYQTKVCSGKKLFIEKARGLSGRKIIFENSYLENVYLIIDSFNDILIDFNNVFLRNTKIQREQIENHILQDREQKLSEAKNIYLLLKNNFHSIGQYEDESWAFKKEKDMERLSYSFDAFTKNIESKEEKNEEKDKKVKKSKFISYLNWLKGNKFKKWLWSCFCNAIYGYGEKPQNVIFSAMFIIILFSVFFSFLGINSPEIIEIKSPTVQEIFNGDSEIISKGILISKTTNYSMDCLYFSAITFTTLGYGDFRPLEGWGRILAGSEAFIGAFMMALFVYTFARRTGGR